MTTSALADSGLVFVDGFHALKHALRFGAEIDTILALDKARLEKLATDLAPDILPELRERADEVDHREYIARAKGIHPTMVCAWAKRPEFGKARRGSAPIILLEDARRMENVGAVVRVAAGAGAAGVATTGVVDPWHPAAIRGSAGLHFALEVRRLASFTDADGPLIAFDPDGRTGVTELPRRSVLAFGTERDGLSPELLAAAALVVALPMRPGVSSLNLATSVAAACYRYGPWV